MEATYLIPACNMQYLADKLADLNKRARRIGCAEITMEHEVAYIQKQYRMLTVHGTMSDDVWVREGEVVPCLFGQADAEAQPTGKVREWFNVTIKGDTPRYEGYSLVAVLEPLVTEDGAENIIQAVPGNECPAEYRDRVGQCDHCNTIRQRNQTFVVRHEDGTHNMVGRQCLKDFLGHNSPHSLASMAEMLASLEQIFAGATDPEGREGRGESSWTLEAFLRTTSASIRVSGWTSGKQAFEEYTTSTKQHVLYLLAPPNPLASETAKREWQADQEKYAVTDSDRDRAARAIEWALDIDRESADINDYMYNVNLVSRAGYTTGKTAGIAASIIAVYSRWAQKDLERRIAATRLDEYVGTIKKREEFTVDVAGIHTFEGSYGTTGIHRMYDPQGRTLVWFASGSASWLEEGKRYRIKATVKDHSVYEGKGDYPDRKQTIVNRVKVLENLGDTPEQVAPEAPQADRGSEILTAPVSLGDLK